jgi:deoxycytidylate deaminase
MTNVADSPDLPEIFFGIAGPIGVDIVAISDSLQNALRSVRYGSQVIHLTKEMMDVELATPPAPPIDKSFYSEVNYKIHYANQLCAEFKQPDALARIALRTISHRREQMSGGRKKSPKQSTAYIIRQLKRPDEVHLLRKVYGKRFVLVSAYGPADQRTKLIEERLKRTLPPSTPQDEICGKACELIEKDSNEETNDYGQRLRETFHLADVFIDGLSKQKMDDKLNRFVQAFFGRTDISPSKEEYGMYAAKSASLRSADLSRQVGAAIFSKDGELITQGCNEVPKALGGTYWDSEEPDFRDVKIGQDPNDVLKNDILRDLFDRLAKSGFLSETAHKLGSLDEMIKKLTHKRKPKTDDKDGALATAAIMDVTEYGRVVHAEMCAICDAARLGRSIKGGTLFCTTFPCHNCTKHILAAGVDRVVYMEPYPKSKAKDLHKNEIEIENEVDGRVSFVPFLGISPFRYRDIFQKIGKRKNDDGIAKRWMSGYETPMIDNSSNSYIEVELEEITSLFGEYIVENNDGDKHDRDAEDIQSQAPDKGSRS